MSVCNDFIQFDQAEDWIAVANVFRTAIQLGENSYVPIDPFDLGVALAEPYIVAIVQVFEGKTTWTFGGRLSQTWNFQATGIPLENPGVAESATIPLFIDQAQAIALNRNTSNTFRLKYYPPYWFRAVRITIWKYIGVVENFTKDTLFDIGNKLGIGTLNEPNNLSNLIINQGTLIESIQDQLNEIQNLLIDPIDSSPIINSQLQAIDDIVTQNVSQINQNINNLANNLSSVLSGDSTPDTLITNTPNTVIEEEFL